ncbi:MAG: mitochondrial small ribosomal subunit protein uS17m [Deltaproteobacteria bacterium]|nr:mitochondrial small ribosomal subunit protein uS17m [Deltaproteobacteria bacterium]MBI3293531.1 mitochondrial small ribosomal subunit protein uS17m [Deltaproteobacteria bacterium]
MSERKRTQSIKGIVVSDSMDKTRIIAIDRTKQHRLYKKKQVGRVKLFIHDEKNLSKLGDQVLVSSIRPLSGNKCFRLVKVLNERVGP